MRRYGLRVHQFVDLVGDALSGLPKLTRAAKCDIDREELRDAWQKQAADVGLDARALVREAAAMCVGPAIRAPVLASERTVWSETPVTAIPDAAGPDGTANDRNAASEAVVWAMAHLSEREAVFARADLFAAALAQPRLFPCSGISLRVPGGQIAMNVRNRRPAALSIPDLHANSCLSSVTCRLTGSGKRT